MKKIILGSKVRIAKDYGGGRGWVENIKGSFMTIKVKSDKYLPSCYISVHESDLTLIK